MDLSIDRVLDRFSMISRFARLIAIAFVCWPALAVAAGPVYDVGDLLHSPQAKARGMWLPIDFGGPIEQDTRLQIMGNPIKLSGYEPGAIGAPHLLGQDTDAVLAELGDDHA